MISLVQNVGKAKRYRQLNKSNRKFGEEGPYSKAKQILFYDSIWLLKTILQVQYVVQEKSSADVCWKLSINRGRTALVLHVSCALSKTTCYWWLLQIEQASHDLYRISYAPRRAGSSGTLLIIFFSGNNLPFVLWYL